MIRNSKHSLARLLLALCLIGTSLAVDPWIIREDGSGPIKIGMTLAQLQVVLHEKFAPDEQDEQGCFYVTPHGHDHISLMIIDGRLARIDVDAPGIATSSGLQVGDTEAQAQKVYGSRLKVTSHQYIDDGHYLTVRSADGLYGTRFETEKGKIIEFYAGSYEAIQYVEGCE